MKYSRFIKCLLSFNIIVSIEICITKDSPFGMFCSGGRVTEVVGNKG